MTALKSGVALNIDRFTCRTLLYSSLVAVFAMPHWLALPR